MLDQLLAMGPEILLAVGGTGLLTFDMFSEDEESRLLPGIAGAVMLAALLWTFATFINGVQPEILFGMYSLDNLTSFLRVFSISTSLLVLVLTMDYIRGRSEHIGEFYALLLFVTAAVIMTGAATNLILIFVAFEFLSLTSYIMVGWLRDDVRSNEGAIKYLLYGAISSAVMLYGMSLLYGVTGQLDLAAIATVFRDPGLSITGLSSVGVTAAVMMIVGFGFKVAVVPFHQWSPDAYEGAPTPVTTFLSVGPKAAGFAIMMRVLGLGLGAQVAMWQPVLNTIAILTLVVGNLTALVQTDMKRLIAYSSIAQAGFILMGIVANNPLDNNGYRGVLIYLFAYLFTNVGLFVAVIAVEQETGSTAISAYRGLIRRSPFIAGAMVVFFLSLLGIPPTAGFLGKFLVFQEAIEAELYVLSIVGVLMSVVSGYYYLNVIKTMFFSDPQSEDVPVRFSRPLGVALTLTLAGTLLMNIVPEPFFDLIGEPVNLLGMLLAPFG